MFLNRKSLRNLSLTGLALVVLARAVPPAFADDTAKPQNSAMERWNTLSPEDRAHALENYRRWKALSPNEQTDLKHRWEKYRALPPERQQQIREQWRHFEGLSPDQQAKIRDRWQRWQKLTPGARQQMMSRRQANRQTILQQRSRTRRRVRQ